MSLTSWHSRVHLPTNLRSRSPNSPSSAPRASAFRLPCHSDLPLRATCTCPKTTWSVCQGTAAFLGENTRTACKLVGKQGIDLCACWGKKCKGSIEVARQGVGTMEVGGKERASSPNIDNVFKLKAIYDAIMRYICHGEYVVELIFSRKCSPLLIPNIM